jgi:hypothetical protein
MNISPTLEEIENDEITKLSKENWTKVKKVTQNSKIIKEIYEKSLLGKEFKRNQILLLEYSHYLEEYLLLKIENNKEHIMSM